MVGEIWSYGESRLINSNETSLGSIAPRFRRPLPSVPSLTGRGGATGPDPGRNGTFSSTLLPAFEQPKKDGSTPGKLFLSPPISIWYCPFSWSGED